MERERNCLNDGRGGIDYRNYFQEMMAWRSLDESIIHEWLLEWKEHGWWCILNDDRGGIDCRNHFEEIRASDSLDEGRFFHQ